MLQNAARRAGDLFVTMPSEAKVGTAIAMIALACATSWLVYATGGVRFAYLHLMYVPVVLSALAFGVAGGVLAGIVGGMLLGPQIPLDTATGEAQEAINWIYRTAFFTMVGALVGAGAQLLRRHLRELEWLHEHHPDTGLLNISGLMKQLDDMMGSAPAGTKLVVSVTQLNNFLEIQNTFGTAFGLRLLAQVVERAKRVVPPGSLLALLQPDRLATVVQGVEAARETAQRVEDAVSESYLLDGVPIHVAASIGVAHFPTHARSPEELLQRASIAMHWANTSKATISLYDDANDRTSRDNLILLGALPDAIANGELRVWHQAKLALATGELAATEALLRWQHPQRGLVPPGRFVPQLEETTLINPVTQWMIAAAFADAGRWRAAGHRLGVSVNLSVRNLRDKMLLDVLEHSVQQNELAPGDVELEITESAVMSDPQYCIRLISLLRERGYAVSIDDFGVGQSSLGYVQKLNVSTIKIDMEFVKTLATDPNNQKIVRAILHLAESMGLKTVAEGVEDERALELLREWGCDYAQGYFVHKPAPYPDLIGFLQARREIP